MPGCLLRCPGIRKRATWQGAFRGHYLVRIFALKRLLSFFAIAIVFVSAAAQSRDQNIPGQFDYYVLSLSWSPSFCETAIGNTRNQQCGPRPYSFVVHGLWPQYEQGFPESCQVPPPRLSRRIMLSMLDMMPAPRLIYHEWDQHGTCSGLNSGEYFNLVRKARARVIIPPQYVHPEIPLRVTPAQVINAFLTANEGLKPTGVIIDCDRKRLREVRICFSRDLKFRDCSRTGQRVCRADFLIMPPLRRR
jgi:ribonuclease T2